MGTERDLTAIVVRQVSEGGGARPAGLAVPEVPGGAAERAMVISSEGN